MAHKSTYVVRFRRRRQGKTNYRKRLAMLKSEKTRLVVRKTNNNILCQFVNNHVKGDKTIVSTHSTELIKYGWKGHRGNLPAAYLTGLLAGKKAKTKVKAVILDMGMHEKIKGARIFAALKGVSDVGIDINYNPEIIGSEDRIKGKHISEKTVKMFEKVKEKILNIKEVKFVKKSKKSAVMK